MLHARNLQPTKTLGTSGCFLIENSILDVMSTLDYHASGSFSGGLMSTVQVVDHPAAHVLLTNARDCNTIPRDFADAMRRLGYILATEVLRTLRTKDREVTTPLGMSSTGKQFDGRVGLVPVLRAGGILEEGFRVVLGDPHVWHLGLRRDEQTLKPVQYLCKVPRRTSANLQRVVILEVMLATGGSACAAIDILKNRGYENITFVCVFAAPEGVACVRREHPDVDIVTVVIDERLTDDGDDFPKGYIVPGCGDAGDRINDTLDEAGDDPDEKVV